MTTAVEPEHGPRTSAAPVIPAQGGARAAGQPDLPVLQAPAWQRRLSRALVGLDLTLASLAALVALLVRFGHGSVGYQVLTVAFPIGFVACIALTRGYEGRFLGAGSEEYRRVA